MLCILGCYGVTDVVKNLKLILYRAVTWRTGKRLVLLSLGPPMTRTVHPET